MYWKSPPIGWSNLHLRRQCKRLHFPCLCSDLIESDFKSLADLISEKRQLIPFLFCLSLDSRNGQIFFCVLVIGTFSPENSLSVCLSSQYVPLARGGGGFFHPLVKMREKSFRGSVQNCMCVQGGLGSGHRERRRDTSRIGQGLER